MLSVAARRVGRARTEWAGRSDRRRQPRLAAQALHSEAMGPASRALLRHLLLRSRGLALQILRIIVRVVLESGLRRLMSKARPVSRASSCPCR